MTKPITDASTAVAEAIANKFVFGDGYTGGIYALVGYRITYNGATWDVANNRGSIASYADVTATWDGADNKLDISLAGLDNQFTGQPVALVSALAGATHASGPRYSPEASVTSATTIAVRFKGNTSPLAYQTTESSAMNFEILIFGKIG